MNKEAEEFFRQKAIDILRKKGQKIAAKRTVCPKCGDYGWIYNDDATSRKVCPCHY